jgi:hypothetical protein
VGKGSFESKLLLTGELVARDAVNLAKAQLDADVPPGVLSAQDYEAVLPVRSRAELAYQEEQRAWRLQNESSEASLGEVDPILRTVWRLGFTLQSEHQN